MISPISQFTGQYDFLSNFYPCLIWDGQSGITFPSVEHLYQSKKFSRFDIKEKIAMLTAGQAKRYGQKNQPEFSNWNDVKLWEMSKAVSDKFYQNPNLMFRLNYTGVAKLIEGNLWHDNFWGVCHCEKCDGVGLNYLGKILMGIRDNQRYIYKRVDFKY